MAIAQKYCGTETPHTIEKFRSFQFLANDRTGFRQIIYHHENSVPVQPHRIIMLLSK